MKRLSDLELTILGVVKKKAPCTPYAVAQEFFSSPSSYWRGSAGAVYPAVARLHGLGLLSRRQATRLGRPCALFTITAKGIAALRRWLRPPLPDAAAAITFDPVRARAYFLAVLPAEQQCDFLDDAERQLLAQVPRLQAECERYRQSGDWFSEQAQRGALYVMEGRLAWIREFRQALQRRQRETSTTGENRHVELSLEDMGIRGHAGRRGLSRGRRGRAQEAEAGAPRGSAAGRLRG